jgi:hypothetical protein
MKKGDTVAFNEFPYEGDRFLIVGDKNDPYNYVTPMGNEEIEVEDGKDFIILKWSKEHENYQPFGEYTKGKHVAKSELKLLS